MGAAVRGRDGTFRTRGKDRQARGRSRPGSNPGLARLTMAKLLSPVRRAGRRKHHGRRAKAAACARERNRAGRDADACEPDDAPRRGRGGRGALFRARRVPVIVLAVLLAFVLAPFVDLMRRLRLGRVFSVIVAVLVALGVIGTLGTVMGLQVAELASDLPRYQQTNRDKVGGLREGVLRQNGRAA